MSALNAEQIAELDAIDRTTRELRGATSLWAGLYRDPILRPLIQRKLITWEKGGEAFGPRHRHVELTIDGRALLREAMADPAMQAAVEEIHNRPCDDPE